MVRIWLLADFPQKRRNDNFSANDDTASVDPVSEMR